MSIIDGTAQQTLFTEAHTHYHWDDKPVDNVKLHELYNLMKFGPTSANCCPLRIIFITSQEAKERLKPCLAPTNVEKSMTAPVVAILAMDMQFYDELPKLYPQADARSWFAGNEKSIYDTAFRNSSLQGGYFIMAARAVGLDCGPMSGFDTDKMNAEFFPDNRYKVNFICNLGHGDRSKMFPRNPRLTFDEAAKII